MIKTLNTPTRAVLVAHVGSLFWFRTKVCDFPSMWIPQGLWQKKKKKKKNLAFLSSFFFPPFFFSWKPFFFLNIRVFVICIQMPNTNGEKKKDDFSLKILNPLHFRDPKSLNHRLNLHLHPFTPPPPHTHSAEQNCQGGQTSPSVGMLVKGVCIIVNL